MRELAVGCEVLGLVSYRKLAHAALTAPYWDIQLSSNVAIRTTVRPSVV